MILSDEHKLEILGITLECLKDKDKEDAFIIVDEETVAMWLDHLEILQRFEDCYLINENKHKFLFEYAMMIPAERLGEKTNNLVGVESLKIQR